MLRAENLSKKYADHLAVEDVSLSVHAGETVALLGAGGAGKSTTFRMLVGVDRPTNGRIVLDGVEISGTKVFERARLGLNYLPQQPSLIRDLTVSQNILAALEPTESGTARRKQIAAEMLVAFGVSHLATSWPGRLSGGERRRCEIARTMATRPKYVLLDEPFAGLDPIAIGEMRDIIRAIAVAGVGVLVADHNVKEMLRFVERAYLIESGRVVAHGDVDKIIQDPNVRRSYLGADFSL
jgi:lipopolysaccharide export system ATP-binding protein